MADDNKFHFTISVNPKQPSQVLGTLSKQIDDEKVEVIAVESFDSAEDAEAWFKRRMEDVEA